MDGTVTERAATGVEGLDDVLGGGFPRSRVYLIQGDPGAGKTTLALQFLMAGRDAGERGVYVTLSETKEELDSVARSHGWSLEGIELLSLPTELPMDEENTFFHPSQVELQETTRRMLDAIERVRPQRVVIDSLTEIQLLAESSLRFRRQVMALKDFFTAQRSTVLMLEDQSFEAKDSALRSIVNGVVVLQNLAPTYGSERRRLNVVKLRAVKYRGGFHDFKIERGGLVVFPRLVAAEHHVGYVREAASTGLEQLDQVLGGGLDRGTSSLFLGPAGSGKSAIAMKCAGTSAERGEKAAIFAFDEGLGTLVARSEGLGTPLRRLMESGALLVSQVDPAEVSPGEFAQRVRSLVEHDGVRMVVIDSLNGYLSAMPEERMLSVHLHELFTYLRQRGVVIISTVAQMGMVSALPTSQIEVSYVADTVVVFRYFEARGEVRKALSVVKKRSGPHDRSIRELCLEDGEITLSEPLREFRGVLTGVPFIHEPGSSTMA